MNAATGPATNTPVLRIADLLDPYGRYEGLIRPNPELATAKVVIPDIHDRQGVLITPGEYDSKIQDGDYIEVEVFLKLWDIQGNVRNNSNGPRIYQIMLRSMKLLPYHTYSQANILLAGSSGPSDAPDTPEGFEVPDSSDASATVPADSDTGKGKASAKGKTKGAAKGKGKASPKGKRKADDEEQPAGQSPTRKSLVFEEENDWVMTDDNN